MYAKYIHYHFQTNIIHQNSYSLVVKLLMNFTAQLFWLLQNGIKKWSFDVDLHSWYTTLEVNYPLECIPSVLIIWDFNQLCNFEGLNFVVSKDLTMKDLLLHIICDSCDHEEHFFRRIIRYYNQEPDKSPKKLPSYQ